ncbi:hypothetical protein ACFSOZ_19350 [Mesorhizobium newzealandense]|uniref:Uncharacterized protein n=3 Tax=Mesorhizobium TaxID=68287 RepID=A0ABW4WAK6_9HYPH
MWELEGRANAQAAVPTVATDKNRSKILHAITYSCIELFGASVSKYKKIDPALFLHR